VVVARTGAEFQSFGFLLQQDLADVNFEFSAPREWQRFMTPIARIEDLTGVVFPEQVRRSDQSFTEGGERLRRRGGIEFASGAAPPSPASSGAQDANRPYGGAADAPRAERDVIEAAIELWKEEQRNHSAVGPTVRFVLNFAAKPDDGMLGQRLAASLPLIYGLRPLFESDPDLDRFRLLTIPSASRLERSDMFEFTRSLRDITGAETVDPDLGTDYYDCAPRVLSFWDGRAPISHSGAGPTSRMRRPIPIGRSPEPASLRRGSLQRRRGVLARARPSGYSSRIPEWYRLTWSCRHMSTVMSAPSI
jgi:hypothetical protein